MGTRRYIRPERTSESREEAAPASDRATRMHYTRYNPPHDRPRTPKCILGSSVLDSYTLQKSATWAYNPPSEIPAVTFYKTKKVKRGNRLTTKLIKTKRLVFKRKLK